MLLSLLLCFCKFYSVYSRPARFDMGCGSNHLTVFVFRQLVNKWLEQAQWQLCNVHFNIPTNKNIDVAGYINPHCKTSIVDISVASIQTRSARFVPWGAVFVVHLEEPFTSSYIPGISSITLNQPWPGVYNQSYNLFTWNWRCVTHNTGMQTDINNIWLTKTSADWVY